MEEQYLAVFSLNLLHDVADVAFTNSRDTSLVLLTNQSE